MDILSLWERAAILFRKKTAIVDSTGKWKFRDVEGTSSYLANKLLALGVRSGDRIAVVAQNSGELLAAYIGIWKAGGTVIPINPSVPVANRVAYSERVNAKILIANSNEDLDQASVPGIYLPSKQAEVLPGERLPVVRSGTNIAACFLTSATTGRAKIVEITDHHLSCAIVSQLATMGCLSPTDSLVVCNPLSHGSMYFSLSFLLAGGRLVFPKTLAPQSIITAILSNEATHLWLVPEMLRFLLRARGVHAIRTMSLREVIYAAAPMPPQLLINAREQLGCDFRQIYGMTEALFVGTQVPTEHVFEERILHERALPVGRPAPGMKVAVQDDDGTILPAETIGRICVSGDAIADGYLPDQEEDEKSTSLRRGRWLLTGDIGWIDLDGFIRLNGRVSDVIVRGGQKISPVDVERVIQGHPGVAEVAVVGVADSDWGQTPHAFIVPVHESLDVGDVMRYCAARLSPHMRPTLIHVVDDIPKTPTGKVQRKRLTNEND